MEIIKNFKKGIIQWLWIIFVLLLSWISYAAWTWLKAWNWDTLDVSKWNSLVSRTEPITFECLYDRATWVSWWRLFTWTTALCWGTYKPQDFTYCNFAPIQIDWSAVSRWLIRLTQTDWWVFADNTTQRAILRARFMCWN